MVSYHLAQGTPTGHIVEDEQWTHASHCLGDLRQALLCNLDVTLLAQPAKEASPGDGQSVQCKNLTATIDWLVEHQHIEHHPPGMGPNATG